MSVLIKGFDEIPDDGEVLTVKHYDNGKAYIKLAFMMGYSSELIKLPETHGRLIDADELEELFRELIGSIAKKPEMTPVLEHMVRASAMVIDMIKDASTVIEAEGTDE